MKLIYCVGWICEIYKIWYKKSIILKFLLKLKSILKLKICWEYNLITYNFKIEKLYICGIYKLIILNTYSIYHSRVANIGAMASSIEYKTVRLGQNITGNHCPSMNTLSTQNITDSTKLKSQGNYVRKIITGSCIPSNWW